MELTIVDLVGVITILCGIWIIKSRNPVQAMIGLLLVFVSVTILLLTLGLEYFSMIVIIVYLGAIAVLFLFVVMLLNIRVMEVKTDHSDYRIVTILGFISIVICTFSELYVKEELTRVDNYIDWYDKLYTISNIEGIAELLYTQEIHYFLLAGVILLVAMLGSVMLANDSEK